MVYREFTPSPELGRFVECFWHLERRGPADWELIYPDGCAEIIWNLGDPAEMLGGGVSSLRPRHFVHGQLDRAIRVRSALRTELVAIRLRPWGTSGLLGVPGDTLTGRAEPIESVAPKFGRLLGSIVESGEPLADRIESLDDALCRWVRRASARASATAPVASRCLASVATVGDLCRWTGWSARTLQRRFRSEIGLSPKRFLQVARFVRFLRLSEVEREAPLAELATAAGYYDQSHLHPDLLRFTGTTPARFRARRRALFDRLYGGDRLAWSRV